MKRLIHTQTDITRERDKEIGRYEMTEKDILTN